jgi:pimeloyl-ACP methyl ester carboxylesterase
MATLEATTPIGTDPRQRLLAGMPLTERRLELAGISTAVLEGGAGIAPVVLLHEQGEFAARWMRVIPDLALTHRVIAPDLPGHGASSAGDGPLDTDAVLAWLGELIEQTCPTPPALVGHMLGGAIAARFAAAHPGRVSRLVLVDSFGLRAFRPSPRFALALVRYVARPGERSFAGLMRHCIADPEGVREQLGERWEPYEAYVLEGARSAEGKSALPALMKAFAMRAIAPEELERIAVPTTLIWGRQDPAARLKVAEAASDRYGWPLQVIDDAGDDPPMEQPEAFLRALHGALGTTNGSGR